MFITVTIFVLTGPTGSQWPPWISRNSRNEGNIKQLPIILVNKSMSIIMVTLSFYRDNLVLLESEVHRVHKDKEERLVTWEDLVHWA